MPPSDNGTIDASDITPTVDDITQGDTTDGRYMLFDAKTSAAATKVAATVEQNQVAYMKNRDNWKKETKDFNDKVDSQSSFEVKDMADWEFDRDIGTVKEDGTIVGVPAEHTSGGIGISIPGISGSGDADTIYNTLGVASANKANAQAKLLNEMASKNSLQRKAFIKSYENRKVMIQAPNGRMVGTQRLGARNAGVLYDLAVARGFQAAATHFNDH